MADNEGEGGGVVGVIFGCRDNLDMCICNPCCGDNVINHLSTIQGFEVISNNSHRIGSIQNLDDFRDLKKIVFVWNGCTYFAKRLLEYAKVAQLDKESGNFIIHIRIDGNSCLPEESKKWDKVITYTCDMKAGSGFLDTIKQDLEAKVLNIRDLSPCGNIGEGLAWTYCLKYLQHRLLGPEGDASLSYQNILAEKHLANAHTKLMVIIPKSGRYFGTVPGLEAMHDPTSNSESVDQTMFVGGVNRFYRTTVYNIPQGKMVHKAGVEYVTPVRAIRKMTEQFIRNSPSIAGLSKYQARKEIKILLRNVEYFVERKELGELIDIIVLDDQKFDGLNDESYKTAIAGTLKTALLEKINPY